MRYFTSSLPPRVAQGCYSEFGAGTVAAVSRGKDTKYTRYMYNDDPLRQRMPHTRTSQVTKVTHTQTLLHSKAGRAGGSAYGVGVVGRSLSGVVRG